MTNRGFALVTLLLSGCFTTKVYAPVPAHGPELQDRQWFTLGGLVSLSDPAGQQCRGGVARAESEIGFVDILINVGVAFAGGVAGTVLCSSQREGYQRTCGLAGTGLAPLLFATRTVQYTCAGARAAAQPSLPAGASVALPAPTAP